jgi:Eco29kI restriction endonuclease
MTDATPFNPLDKISLAASVAGALLERAPVCISGIPNFWGAGIYAIYYLGDFEPYRVISEVNGNEKWDAPIYVGKAVPEGSRKGGRFNDVYAGSALFKRLSEHVECIKLAVSTLRVEDFFCRYLIVEDIWIPLGESLMISRFSPIWNTLVDGFGNHDPGSGRYNGLKPRWDVLHPGRVWADRCKPRQETAAMIAGEVQNFLRTTL